MKKVILYIATSADGFIADNQGNVDWLPQPKNDNDLEIVGYNNLIQRIDTIVMGNNSYQQIKTFGAWGWPDKKTYVFTIEPMQSDVSYITFIQDTPKAFLQKINRLPGKDIWLLGGAQLAQSFAKENLIDEVILTIVPQKIDSGLPLGVSFSHFNLKEEKPLMDGMVQRIYFKK